ncbi:MAG: GNAT family N-acetyltransferase [Blastocatellia bacterium]|nr:GNAT family N-acetyltransferase [Blastocatellia bacterium]
MKPPERLVTQRLNLRIPSSEDAEAIFKTYAQDDEVTKYLIWKPHQNIEQTQEFLQRCLTVWKEALAYPWIIEEKNSLKLLGMIETHIEDYKADIGYVLARKYWGQGYMTEAAEAVVNYLKSLDQIYRVWAVCDVENLASARLLEKIGMQREGILKRWIILPNVSSKPRDCYCYATTKL